MSVIGPRTLGRVVAGLALAIVACGRTELDGPGRAGGGAGGSVGVGGLPGTGGFTGTGGFSGTGGSRGTGGLPGTGGLRGTGGVTGTGGLRGTGGVPGTGGERPPPLRVFQLAAGDDHTCALLSDGSVRCWGKNDHGQLGHADTNTIGDDELPSSARPVSVTTIPGVTVTRLAAGLDRTCALLTNGTVTCWGDNSQGQLGYGHTKTIGDDETPSAAGPVSVTSEPGVTVSALALGGGHTCALLTNGTIKCWGAGFNGALGYGNTDTIGDNELPSSVGPVSVSTAPGVKATAVAAGRFETCAILSDRSLVCWGLNDYGELGYGNTQRIGDDELPSSAGPVSVSTTPGVVPVSVVGGDYHTCALLSNGTVRCWGSGLDGELGYGNKMRIGDDELPSSVGPVSITTMPGVVATTLVAGFDHNCVLLSDLSTKCWGANVFAELGLGNFLDVGDDELPSSIGPVSVTSDPQLAAVALTGGYGHTCALLSDGSVKCWGNNKYGQLGYGNTATIGDDELPSSVGPVSVF